MQTDIQTSIGIVQVRVEDDRKPIERLRRIELWRLADRYHVSYPVGATKNEMLRLFAEACENGLDLSRPPTAQARPIPTMEERFDVMEINELRNLCKARGIKLARTDNRAALIDKLRGNAAVN
jgi:DNA primase large subunit